MEVFRELYVQAGNTEQLAVLMDQVERVLSAGWTRDRLLEKEVGAHMRAKRLYCFTYNGDDRFPRTTIALVEDEPGRLKLSNIFPRTSYVLEMWQANDLLEHFYRRIVEPCAARIGVSIELTSKNKDLSDWLPEKALEKFRRFSSGADKRAGYLLSIDRERWLEFVLTAHRERSRLDAGTLRRWLIEVERWSPEVADILAGQYAFAEELLTFSESHRAGA